MCTAILWYQSYLDKVVKSFLVITTYVSIPTIESGVEKKKESGVEF